ncbi:hypothetical protein ABZY58_11345 [Micromonospora tulbaghiae]|uniref:hypothetical protein n=1 Tax=Micromonospora tulbaghiae TaxID=479978 RepID=UPI0033B38ED0
MAEHSAARLPLVWRAGDPEPDRRVTEVRTGYGETWRRIRVGDWNPLYRWFNGDKVRPWDMLTHNRDPLYNTARLRRMHAMYGRRKRRG